MPTYWRAGYHENNFPGVSVGVPINVKTCQYANLYFHIIHPYLILFSPPHSFSFFVWKCESAAHKRVTHECSTADCSRQLEAEWHYSCSLYMPVYVYTRGKNVYNSTPEWLEFLIQEWFCPELAVLKMVHMFLNQENLVLV